MLMAWPIAMTACLIRALVMLVLPVAILVVIAVVSKVLSARSRRFQPPLDRPAAAALCSSPSLWPWPRCGVALYCIAT